MSTYAMAYNQEVKCNVITAVTDEALNDGRREWAKIGFLSRFIIFTYSYSLSTVVEILGKYAHCYLDSKDDGKTVNFELPREEVGIELPIEIAEKLTPLATKMGEQFGLYGIRAMINLRSLIKALAYRNKKKTVTELEFQELMELADFMNFDYNPIR